MAKQKGNVVTHGLSGKIGDLLIFRQVNGQTVVSKIPERSQTASEKQKEQRKRFQRATVYAKAAVDDPETKALYAGEAGKSKGKTAYNIAVADFFNAPDIETVDLSDYTGSVGDTVRVAATDDFLVKSVYVSIVDADGATVEEGDAVRGTGNLWIYTATKHNDSVSGYRIEITASDLPGNIAKVERNIHE
jgi:predicted membrane-bound mannosyltransferase